MHFYKNRREMRIQTCYIARLFLYILAALCGHHLKDFTLLSSFSDAFFFARHPTTYEVHSYFFMRQRGNSVIVFCECNIVKRKTVCTTPQCWLLLQHSEKFRLKKKRKKCPYKIVANVMGMLWQYQHTFADVPSLQSLSCC